MDSAASSSTSQRDIEAIAAENAALRARLQQAEQQLQSLTHQLDWFKRQLFGRTSEKRIEIDPAVQPDLLAALGRAVEPPKPLPSEEITYTRRKGRRDNTVSDSGLRFDDSVPVERIVLPPDEALADVPADHRVVISEKVTHRLAQRPGSYVVLEYVRPVIQRTDTGELVSTPAPANVLEGTVADVSVLAGMLIDKFMYHLPLYRQHQRLAASGIDLARGTLTNWAGRAIDLLKPVFDAQLANILRSRVLAMDETPIKAGRKSKGKMRQGYLWPVYGDSDEIVFCYTSTHSQGHVPAILGEDFQGVLLSDGYEAYARYAQAREQVIHAQCWAHTRRYFERAAEAEPQAADEALSLIGALYDQERYIRKKALTGKTKLAWRTQHSEPVVKAFWQWCDTQCQRHDLLPSNPLSKALHYAMARTEALQVFLSDPDVPIDTNHVERALRPIPLGRRNWLFCWTEIGAERVGVIQSLLASCRLQGIDPYTYLVDVLQRVGHHPAKAVVELTPRLWKDRFAHQPLNSDLDRYGR
ncbi:MAG TPA: IS66 family transposase [Guyparkeria sp.]|nr:IS66 family transposase [Guyparkeria sp.]